jgi:hypothetical protein
VRKKERRKRMIKSGKKFILTSRKEAGQFKSQKIK